MLLAALGGCSLPSLEAQMNADTSGHDMRTQERRLSGHPLSHYMPIGLTRESVPRVRMPPGARVEVLPNMRRESALMPSGARELTDRPKPHMEAPTVARMFEEREELRAARATSRHATMLFAPGTASPDQSSSRKLTPDIHS